MTALASSTHSVPPTVDVEAVGRWADIPVITLDLAGGAIDRSIVRQMAKVLTSHHAVHWLTIIALDPAKAETYLDRVLAACRERDVFAPQFTEDASRAFHEAWGEALDIAERTCHRDGCGAVGLRDGLCVAHDEAMYAPTLRSVGGAS